MVTDFYRSVMGGIEVMVRNLGLELSARGHDVGIAAISREGFPAFEQDRDIRVHRLQTTTKRLHALYSDADRPAAPPFPDPEATAALKRIIALERPDVIHGHDWLSRSLLPLKRWSGAALVMSLHYYTLSCARKDLTFKGFRCTGPAVGKCLMCGVEHYGPARGIPVVLGHFAAGVFERRAVDMYLPVSYATALGNGLPRSGLPFEVVPNFLASAEGEATDVDRFVRQLPDEAFLLFVGDLGAHKGVDVLLKAYASVERAPPLVLIGKAEPSPPLDLPSNARLLVDWPHEAVREAERRSLAVVVPSTWAEPFGMVVIEAMAAGRPVVASRIGGIPEIVEDGREALLVPPGDPKALGSAIRALVADPELPRRMGRAALARVESFRAPAVVPQVERIYSQVRAASRREQRDAPLAGLA
jgi:glycosyltransferase involved in cell wall biosynthesis